MIGNSDIKLLPRGHDFNEKIDQTILENHQSGHLFYIVLLQIDNLEAYAKRCAPNVVLNLQADLFAHIRRVIPSSQFVGSFQTGFGLVFDHGDLSKLEGVARDLGGLAMKVIRNGGYNDIPSKWTDMIQQFLFPARPSMLFPRVGWAIYPRDGHNTKQLLHSALHHLNKLNR